MPSVALRVAHQEIALGTAVIRIDDLGRPHLTKIRSAAWQLPSGRWVVQVDGLAGGYDLERIFMMP